MEIMSQQCTEKKDDELKNSNALFLFVESNLTRVDSNIHHSYHMSSGSSSSSSRQCLRGVENDDSSRQLPQRWIVFFCIAGVKGKHRLTKRPEIFSPFP
jgi:hypothetical protein